MNMLITKQFEELFSFMCTINEKEMTLLNDRLQDFWCSTRHSKNRNDCEEYFDKCYNQIIKALKAQKWDYFLERELLNSLAWENVMEGFGSKPTKNFQTILLYETKYNCVSSQTLIDLFDTFVPTYFNDFVELGVSGLPVNLMNRIIAKCFLKWLLMTNESQQDRLIEYTHKQLKILEKKQSLEQDFV